MGLWKFGNPKDMGKDDYHNELMHTLKNYGHRPFSKSYVKGAEIKLKFADNLRILHEKGGCDEIEKLKEYAIKNRMTYFTRDLILFYDKNCGKGR